MSNLQTALDNHPSFQSLPGEERAVYRKLAEEFEDSIDLTLYLSPVELATKLGIGNRHLWESFLQFPAVQAFIKAELGKQAQVASRKAMQTLGRHAANGDVQAAKQVNELAGVLSGADSRRTIILHQISRPKDPGPPTTAPKEETSP